MSSVLRVSKVMGEPGGLQTEIFGQLIFSGAYGDLIGVSSGATVTATESGGVVTSASVSGGGSGYTVPPALVVLGGGGFGAELKATISGGAVSAVTVVRGGLGYTSNPSVLVVNEFLILDFVDQNTMSLPIFKEALTSASIKPPIEVQWNYDPTYQGGAATYTFRLIPVGVLTAPLISSSLLAFGNQMALVGVEVFKNAAQFTVGSNYDAALTSSNLSTVALKYRKNS